MATIKGWSVTSPAMQTLSYILDLDHDQAKTTGGYLIYCSHPECGTPALAADTWEIWRNTRRSKTGQTAKHEAIHFIQSFEPGTVTPEQVYDISRQWADEITEGKYPYVLAVHTDKAHLHAHVVVHPFENGVGKKWDIFWSRDLKKFRAISDRICTEHGLEILEKTSPRARTWNEWNRDRSDSQQEFVRKTLEYVVPRVGSYEIFKEVMAKLDFELTDGETTVRNNPDVFCFTCNKVLIDWEKSEGNDFCIRIPKTQTYAYIPKVCFKWILKDEMAQVTVPNDVKFSGLYKGQSLQLSTGDLKTGFEVKDYVERNRTGLRIKPPGYRRFIKTKFIESVQLDCSLQGVKDRIEKNFGITDPELKKLLDSNEIDEIHSLRNELFETAGIKRGYKQVEAGASSKRDRYLNWVLSKADATYYTMLWEREMLDKKKGSKSLIKNRSNLQSELEDVQSAITEAIKIVTEMEAELMEGNGEYNHSNIDRFIKENIVPLWETEAKLKDGIADLDNKLADVDRFDKYWDRKMGRIPENEKQQEEERKQKKERGGIAR